MYVFNLLIEAEFLPFNVHGFFKLDLEPSSQVTDDDGGTVKTCLVN